MRSNDFINEVTYEGNIGAMEVFKFHQIASEKDKVMLKKLINAIDAAKAGKNNRAAKILRTRAWRLIQNVVNVKLQGKEFS